MPKVCASRCGSQGRLFVHNNPGGSAEDMVDLAGRPYRQLKTAFLYRTEYVASCTCQPQPWEAASQDRHRGYTLALAASKGNREAMKELVALQSKMQQTAKAPEPAAAPGPAATRRRRRKIGGVGQARHRDPHAARRRRAEDRGRAPACARPGDPSRRPGLDEARLAVEHRQLVPLSLEIEPYGLARSPSPLRGGVGGGGKPTRVIGAQGVEPSSQASVASLSPHP